MQNVTGMAVPHLSLAVLVVLLDQVIDGVIVVLDLPFAGNRLQEFSELIFRGILDLDLVGDSPQKCLIHQSLRLKIGRKDHKLV